MQVSDGVQLCFDKPNRTGSQGLLFWAIASNVSRHMFDVPFEGVVQFLSSSLLSLDLVFYTRTCHYRELTGSTGMKFVDRSLGKLYLLDNSKLGFECVLCDENRVLHGVAILLF